MRVLVACEYSGTVRESFRKLGHEALSCDLLPTDQPGPHYQGDVFDIINDGWDLMVAHPPCTYLCNSGVHWLSKPDTGVTRLKNLIDGAVFFRRLMEANIPKICIENPVMNKYAKAIIGASQSQTIQPYHFGHPESKATCLWLKGLPLLVPTNDVKAEYLARPEREGQRIHHMSQTKDRWKLRSKTYEGIAQAMANQWSASNG